MAQAAPQHQFRGLPPWAAPLSVLVLMVVLAVAIIVIANRSGGSGAPPEPGPFSVPASSGSAAAFDVREVARGTLTVAPADGAGTFKVTLPPGTSIESLQPIAVSDVAAGDAVVVIGIPNAVRNFAITRVVVLSGASEPGADGVAASPAGFTGVEGSRNPEERVITGGVVFAVDGASVVINGPSGEMTIDAESGAPLYRLDAADPSTIRAGDRLVTGGAALDAAEAVLVLPEGVGAPEE